jgi:dihydrofolate reductase
MGKNGQIGKDNKLLWHISEDLKNFKALTLGHHMLMGRKTYESIGRPLPGRTTIILSRNSQYSAPGCTVVGTYEEAVSIADAADDSELFICGGEEIYKTLLAKAERFYLSFIDFQGEADAYFPDISSEPLTVIKEIKHESHAETPAWTYRVLER